jgi:hypothetical protein
VGKEGRRQGEEDRGHSREKETLPFSPNTNFDDEDERKFILSTYQLRVGCPLRFLFACCQR